MKIQDIISETKSALLSNKVRTSLTMLGIIIGIGSVISMVSIGQGAQKSIQDRIQSIGSNLILITPGAQQGAGFQVSSGRGAAKTLTQTDVDSMAALPLVKTVAPEISARHQVVAKGTNTNTSVVGVTSSYPDVRNVTMAEGTFITDQFDKNISKVAVLGPTARDDLFGVDTEAVGQTIRINNIQFNIVGVTAAKGGTGFGIQDDIIFIPLSSAEQFLAGDKYMTTISASIVDENSMALAQSEITDTLLQNHKIKDSANADFSVVNQNDIVQTASSVTGTFTILLGAIAGISLLVGGIGIMNMMLTTVTERTREIGLRKAIGAKNKDINKQFLIEAVTLTFVGGLIGVALGWGVSFIIAQLGIIQTSVSLSSVLLAFGVSAVIGIIFGYYPARRASNLNPIKALRYE